MGTIGVALHDLVSLTGQVALAVQMSTETVAAKDVPDTILEIHKQLTELQTILDRIWPPDAGHD